MGKKVTILLLGTILALISGFSSYSIAEAVGSSIYVSPAQASKEVGDTFNISVKVDPDGEKVCMVEGKLILDKLSCQKVSTADSLMASPDNKLTCNNLYFSLGIPECTTSKKTLFTVTVKAKNAGAGTADFSGVDIIGEGVSVSHSSSGGNYTVTSVSSCDCEAWSSWQSGDCGGGSCSSNQRLQIRNRSCTPSACNNESESRCISDSSCSIVFEKEEVSETPEKVVSKEETAEEEKPESERKPLVVNPEEETIPQKGLLATAMVGISESVFATILVILCLGGLVVIGAREWSLVREKKKE